MHAMQYEITLPADYHMKIIRNRVATKGMRWTISPGSASRRTSSANAASTGRPAGGAHGRRDRRSVRPSGALHRDSEGLAGLRVAAAALAESAE